MTQKSNSISKIPSQLATIKKLATSLTNIPDTMTDLEIAIRLCFIYSSANARNIPCTLSISKLKSLLKAKTCYYTGIVFDEVHIRSIDRVDNTKGYIDSNVVAADRDFNGKKANLSLEDIQLLYKKTIKFTNPTKNVKKSTTSKKGRTSSKEITISGKSSGLKKSSKKSATSSKEGVIS